MTCLEQLEQWVKGNPIHDHEHGQCCPDFSCCTGKIANEKERRAFYEAFKQGNVELTDGMLMMFLSELLVEQLPYKNVHLAGFEEV